MIPAVILMNGSLRRKIISKLILPFFNLETSKRKASNLQVIRKQNGNKVTGVLNKKKNKVSNAYIFNFSFRIDLLNLPANVREAE